MPALRVDLRVVSKEGVPPGEAAVEATITTDAGEPAALSLAQARHPALVLEVVDEEGERVLLPPPSAPEPADLETRLIAPREPVTIRFAGFLDPALPGGRYRVRYAGRYPALGGTPDDPLESEWVEVAVRTAERPLALGPAGAKGAPGGRPPGIVVAPLGQRILDAIRRFLERIAGRFQTCRRTWEQEVDEERTETISDAPAGFEAWNGDYAWRARFHVLVDETACRITVTTRIRLVGDTTDDHRSAWESAVEAAWSDRFKQCCPSTCCADGYAMAFDIQFVPAGEHQVVNVGDSTTSMGAWGRADTVDVNHEFGHMLGALDEYFTVDGVPFGDGRRPDGAIMNNPSNPPAARNYGLVKDTVDDLLGVSCPTTPVGEPC